MVENDDYIPGESATGSDDGMGGWTSMRPGTIEMGSN